ILVRDGKINLQLGFISVTMGGRAREDICPETDSSLELSKSLMSDIKTLWYFFSAPIKFQRKTNGLLRWNILAHHPSKAI
ncbi:hypothetical protein SK128_022860, partial [Halocaridina rubra]